VRCASAFLRMTNTWTPCTERSAPSAGFLSTVHSLQMPLNSAAQSHSINGASVATASAFYINTTQPFHPIVPPTFDHSASTSGSMSTHSMSMSSTDYTTTLGTLSDMSTKNTWISPAKVHHGNFSSLQNANPWNFAERFPFMVCTRQINNVMMLFSDALLLCHRSLLISQSAV
jgi:hypothetical protein